MTRPRVENLSLALVSARCDQPHRGKGAGARMLTCRSIGSGTAATMMHQGRWSSESVIGSALPAAGGVGSHVLPNAAPAVGTGFDSTAVQIVDLFATWQTANAGNTIQCHQFILEALN
jgi:hypothetical protein